MSVLITLFAFLAFASEILVTPANKDLKCNLCLGSLESDCAYNDSSSYVIQHCTISKTSNNLNITTERTTTLASEPVFKTEENTKFETYCLAITTKDTEYNDAHFERGCNYVSKGRDPCENLKMHYPSVDYCISCQEDLCN